MSITVQACWQLVDETLANSDVEWLLCDLLGQSRHYLQQHPEHRLTTIQYQTFTQQLQRLQEGLPLAYVLEKQPFWSLELYVDERVLIPRPETELLVEQALLYPHTQARVLDLGTGSGAIAAALAYERPAWEIVAVEASLAAYEVARYNFAQYHLNVDLLHGDWYAPVTGTFDLILSNPPYVATDGTVWPGLEHEPEQALYAGPNGMAAYEIVIPGASPYLKPQGRLLLEHGYQQGAAVRELLRAANYTNIKTLQDYNDLERLSCAVKP